MCKLRKSIVKEIEILKDEEDKTGRYDTDNEDVLFGLWFLRSFDVNAGKIIDEDGYGKNKNVDRDERHIEHTACRKQEPPPVFMRQEEEQRRNDGEEDEKLKRVEEHLLFLKNRTPMPIPQELS
jgi:hypothetical protein